MNTPPSELLTIVFRYLTDTPDPNYRVLYQIDYFGLCRVGAISKLLQPLLQHTIDNYTHVVKLLAPEFCFTRPPEWRYHQPKKSVIKQYRKRLINDLERMGDYHLED